MKTMPSRVDSYKEKHRLDSYDMLAGLLTIAIYLIFLYITT